MEPLQGKTALVTGGSRGIGRAICQALARDGASIILHYHSNLAAAERTAASIRGEVRLVQADMGSVSQIDAMFADLANTRIDFLINNAGIWRNTPMGGTSAHAVDEMLHTNLRGPFWVTQCALPLLNDGGRIVNLSSVAGRIATPAGRSLYGATKAGIDSLTRNWALELAPRRILVNAIAPGYITTDMTEPFFSDPKNLESAIRRQPMGKIGTPEEVADVVAFLCSEGARFITGQSINISGGSVI
ncbi:MAG TPA: SDR family NAD(P)-dependent oxidoreductase [Bryobacteraceae bacterium]|nr:SDR family NAD(P)-dependent oxidoreductase [Bryobacteraceae bacterium]